MKAVLLYLPAPDVLTKAPIHFLEHKALLDRFLRRGDLIAVGTWADPQDGSMAIFHTRQAAEAFVKDDPFVKNGVVSSYQIKDWNESLLGG